MSYYLLTVRERVGTRYEANVNVVVQATSPGYAKYHWHKKENRMGGTKDDEHAYQHHDAGYRSELVSVEQLDEDAARELVPRLTEIDGFDEL